MIFLQGRLPALYFRFNTGQLKGLANDLAVVPLNYRLCGLSVYDNQYKQIHHQLQGDAALQAQKGLDDAAFADWVVWEARKRVLTSIRAQHNLNELCEMLPIYKAKQQQMAAGYVAKDELRAEKRQSHKWTDAEYDQWCAEEASKDALRAVRDVVINEAGFPVPGQKLPTESELEDVYIPRHFEKFEEMLQTDPFFQNLLLGIGVHFRQLAPRKRRVVEYLFRKRRLGLVFATGTLAVGISMPCPTVVISGDSPFMSPGEFRQMAGRAGRRGFDDQGHVILLNIPERKLRSCMTGVVTTNAGNTPLSVSLVMKSLARLRAVQAPLGASQLVMTAAEAAQRAVVASLKRLTQKPFAATRVGNQDEEIFRFLAAGAVDYLMKLGVFTFFDSAANVELAVPEPVVSRQFSAARQLSCDVPFSWEEEAGSLEPESEPMPGPEPELRLESDMNLMSSFVSHLGFVEPCNLLLCYLLSAGFHERVFEVCTGADGQVNEQEVKEQLMLILTHTMMVRHDNVRFLEERLARRHHSVVQLPELKPGLSHFADAFNRTTVDSFTQVCVTVWSMGVSYYSFKCGPLLIACGL